MNIIIGKSSGFCAGVKHTITKTEEELSKTNTGIDCLGEIIHNKQVVTALENKGLRTINSIDEANSKLIIRAHGTSKKTYEIAASKNITLIDLTCPKVLKIHKQVQDFASNNYFIFLLGEKKHPETIGTFSFCGNNSYTIENKNDIESAIHSLKSSSLKNVLIISQTTFSYNLFKEISNEIVNSLDSSYNIHIENSICNATSLRQAETEKLSTEVDLMIIVGGKNSANTKNLYKIANNNCKNTVAVETKNDLDISFIKNFKNIGIMAGASTPGYVIDEIYNLLLSL